MGPSVEEVLIICYNGSTPLNKIAAMTIYGKTLQNLLQNQESFEAESWNRALGTQGLPSLFKMMIRRWPLLFSHHGQIYVLVAVAKPEECCMASADMQWLIYSGERIVAHWSLLWFYNSHWLPYQCFRFHSMIFNYLRAALCAGEKYKDDIIMHLLKVEILFVSRMSCHFPESRFQYF